ncbi:hypothetical protein ACFLYA_01685 [Candidatus Dependentiae bacterium]
MKRIIILFVLLFCARPMIGENKCIMSEKKCIDTSDNCGVNQVLQLILVEQVSIIEVIPAALSLLDDIEDVLLSMNDDLQEILIILDNEC